MEASNQLRAHHSYYCVAGCSGWPTIVVIICADNENTAGFIVFSTLTFTHTFYSITHAHTYTHTHTHTLTVGLIIRYLPDVYINKLIPFLAERLDHAPHLQFYVRWCRELLCVHGDSLKERSSEVISALRDLQKSILQKQRDIGTLYVNI